MLTIITGGAMSRKDEFLREKIKKAVLNGKQAYVFVPDQFSFEYDKMLYDIFGARLFNKLEVVGLNRFAESLRKKYGSVKGQTADESTKIISMYKAIRDFRDMKKSLYYTKNIEKPSFVNQMLEMSSTLSRSEITPEILQTAAEKTGGVLSDKLRDISGIYNCYEKILFERELCDGLSVVSEACEILKNNDVFENCEIFFDRYDTFSQDEYKLIEVMLHQSDNMAVAVTLSSENNSKSNLSPFAPTVKTCSDLERIAKSVGVEVAKEKSAQYYYNKYALTYVNANIFCLENNRTPNHEGVKVALMQDMYDEVEFVAAEIKRLVREEKMKYSDIAVISRQLSEYVPLIEGTFERYEIPTFIDAKTTVSKSVLAIYITNILDCIKGKSFHTEKILRMIKSPLSPFKDFEVSAIEEYCYTWNVEGDMWSEPFTACEENRNNLETLNGIRERIVTPVEKFRSSTEDSVATALVGAFTSLLESYNLTSCANQIVKLSESYEGEKSYITDKSTELELVREFKQIWQLFIDSLYSVSENLGEEKISLKEFSDVMSLLLSGMTISNPPQRINTITVASAEHSRLSAVKAVFVLGVNADRLPAAVSKGGMFTEKEKKQLCDMGVEISRPAIDDIKNERLTAYLALTQGSDKLYVCCPKSDKKGKGLVPSVIVKDLFKMFGDVIKINVSKLSTDFYCPTKRAAYSKLSECLNDNTPQSETLKYALKRIPDVAYKVESLENNAKPKPFSLSEEMSEILFFKKTDDKKNISLSPSSIEKYNKCPFDFFCNYGLNLKVPVKNEMNGVNRGNVIHYVLEHILSVVVDGKKKYNEDFETMPEEIIREKVYAYSEHYKDDFLGGDFGKNKRFDNVFSRIKENAVLVVLNIQQELKNSSFKPEAFEYSITKENGEALLKIENSDVVVHVRGIVDRIDTYTDSKGKTYLKIVDYKTGNVNNLYKKIFHGVSLQLLIYLCAILESDNEVNNENMEAGGIVYTPAVYVTSSSSSTEDKKAPLNIDEEDLASVKAGFTSDYVKRKLERLGLVRNDEDLKVAFNHAADKYYIPSGNYDLETLLKIGDYTKNQVSLVGENLSKGIIEAVPLVDATNSYLLKPCSYCAYSSVCGVKNAKPKKLIEKGDDEKFSEILGVNSGKDKEATVDGE